MTDTDISKPENLDRMQRHIGDMEARISATNDLPKEFQICLEPDPNPEFVYYYMANHDRDYRCVFWIDELDLRHHFPQDIGLHTLSHWRALLHSQFSV